jgi:excisionase family DNA binding protein
MSERLLTARELADYLGLKPGTVLDKWERGELPGFKFGRAVRFDLEEVLATGRPDGGGETCGVRKSVRLSRAPVGADFAAVRSGLVRILWRESARVRVAGVSAVSACARSGSAASAFA